VNGQCILVVDDNTAVREVISRLLRSQGYRVIAASGGAEALVICGRRPKEPIDLVLTDITMPQMSGVEFGLRLCTLRPGLKVLYMSGYAASLRNGVPLLQKPVSPEELAAHIQKALA
jgi:two-component system cell cycle sensor histidine kinase/response regulator CckA